MISSRNCGEMDLISCLRWRLIQASAGQESRRAVTHAVPEHTALQLSTSLGTTHLPSEVFRGIRGPRVMSTAFTAVQTSACIHHRPMDCPATHVSPGSCCHTQPLSILLQEREEQRGRELLQVGTTLPTASMPALSSALCGPLMLNPAAFNLASGSGHAGDQIAVGSARAELTMLQHPCLLTPHVLQVWCLPQHHFAGAFLRHAVTVQTVHAVTAPCHLQSTWQAPGCQQHHLQDCKPLDNLLVVKEAVGQQQNNRGPVSVSKLPTSRASIAVCRLVANTTSCCRALQILRFGSTGESPHRAAPTCSLPLVCCR